MNFWKLAWLVPGCSFFAWIQFIYFNSFKIKAWEFSEEHVCGITFLNTTIEDYVFPIALSVVMFVIHQLMASRINTKSSNISKGFSFGFLVITTYFFYTFGGEFSKNQVFFMIFGLFSIWANIKNWDVKEYWAIFGVYVLIAGGWDLWGNNTEIQQWYYRHVLTMEHSIVFNSEPWWWFKVGKAWFPLSIIPQYYITGSLLCQGIIMLTNKFFIDGDPKWV
jgi:hypothetical protein